MRTAREMYDFATNAVLTRINTAIEGAAAEGRTSVDVDNIDAGMENIILPKLESAGYIVRPSIRSGKTVISWRDA